MYHVKQDVDMVFAKDHSMGIISFVITLLQETILTKNTETALKALLARGALNQRLIVKKYQIIAREVQAIYPNLY